MFSLDDYRRVVGDEKINEIIKEAKPLKGKYIVHINSTFYGGGVAEIIESLVILMNDLGIKAGWRHLKGSDSFFEITKLFHNGAQGENIKLNSRLKKIYEEINKRNSIFMHIEKNDAIIIHDPQVLPLIKFYPKKQPWIWRCHIDITKPNKKLWNYLKGFINLYDEMIVSDKKYFKKDIKIPQKVIMPSINPLTDKNRNISHQKAVKILNKVGIKLHKPIISQISRFDYWKDPLGVIDAFHLIKKQVNCQLVLMGNAATDDPECCNVYKMVLKKAKNNKDIKILFNVGDNLTVNALQRESAVVLQKSLKEGFALTVSEALWKKTPVVAGNVGGIPNQIIDGKNGFLINNIKECAERVIYLLKNENKRREMGNFGHRYVKDNFLITRHLLDYIKLLRKFL